MELVLFGAHLHGISSLKCGADSDTRVAVLLHTHTSNGASVVMQ